MRNIKVAITNAYITFLLLDLANLKSVRKASDTFLAASDRLDLLIKNAGIMAQPEGLASNGYGSQFGTRRMGHVLLTKRLL